MYRKRNSERPKKPKKDGHELYARITLRVLEGLWEEMRSIAIEKRITITEVVNEAIREHVKKTAKKK